MQNVTYVGIKVPDIQKAELALSAYHHLGMSRIPEQYGDAGGQLRLVLREGKHDRADGKYHATVLKPLSAVKQECRACEKTGVCNFAGELYFPMDTEQSYNLVIGDGMAKLGGIVVPWMKEGRFIYDDNLGFGAGYGKTELMPAEKVWQDVSRSCVHFAIAVSLQGLGKRIAAYARAKDIKDYVDNSKDGIEKGFEEMLTFVSKDIDRKAVKSLYDGFMELSKNVIESALLSEEQVKTATNIRTNINNYAFYLSANSPRR